MEKKAANWGKRPTDKPKVIPSIDEFVRGTAPGKLVRLNVQVPEDLHKRVKSQCAIEGVSMTDVVIEFLQSRFRG